MYFWNLKGLKKDLKEKNHTEKDAFNYILAFLIFSIIEGILYPSTTPRSNQNIFFSIILGGITAGITFVLLRYFFNRNGGESGEHFLFRITSLSWVIGFRVFVVTYPFIIIYINFNQSLVLGIMMLISLVVGFVYYLVELGESLSEVSGRAPTQDTSTDVKTE